MGQNDDVAVLEIKTGSRRRFNDEFGNIMTWGKSGKAINCTCAAAPGVGEGAAISFSLMVMLLWYAVVCKIIFWLTVVR